MQLVRRREGRPLDPADGDQRHRRDDDGHHQGQGHLAERGQRGTHGQMGNLRKMLRGMCRNTIITYLNAAGAQTNSLPFAAAVTARSATYSLSTVNGASLTCALIRVRT